MGLRDKYQTKDAPPATSTEAGPAATSTPTDPASELAALRAKLAGRGNVNPPEATIPDDAMTRTTRETADGGAELIASTSAPEPSGSTSTEPKKSRTRKPPAAAEAPSAAGVGPVVALLTEIRDLLRARE